MRVLKGIILLLLAVVVLIIGVVLSNPGRDADAHTCDEDCYIYGCDYDDDDDDDDDDYGYDDDDEERVEI